MRPPAGAPLGQAFRDASHQSSNANEYFDCRCRRIRAKSVNPCSQLPSCDGRRRMGTYDDPLHGIQEDDGCPATRSKRGLADAGSIDVNDSTRAHAEVSAFRIEIVS